MSPEDTPDETVVAVYDTPAHAELARQDVLAAGVPDARIRRLAASTEEVAASVSPFSRAFWRRLFGGEPEHGTDVLGHAVARGGTVVAVSTHADEAAAVIAILGEHAPVDLDERARHYAFLPPVEPPFVPYVPGAADIPFDPSVVTNALDEEALRQAAEVFAGRRLVNHGGARVRRYVAASDPPPA